MCYVCSLFIDDLSAPCDNFPNSVTVTLSEWIDILCPGGRMCSRSHIWPGPSGINDLARLYHRVTMTQSRWYLILSDVNVDQTYVTEPETGTLKLRLLHTHNIPYAHICTHTPKFDYRCEYQYIWFCHFGFHLRAYVDRFGISRLTLTELMCFALSRRLSCLSNRSHLSSHYLLLLRDNTLTVIQTIGELKPAITGKIRQIPKEECVRVIDNFARHVQVCLQRRGQHLEHILKRT